MSANDQIIKSSDALAMLAGTAGRSIITHEPINPVDIDELEKILKSLDKWTSINDGHHNEKRSSERLPYRGQPVIVVESESYATEHRNGMVCFEAWGRDVSSGGTSFLCPELLVAVNFLDEEAEPVQLKNILKEEVRIVIGLEQEGNSWIWLSGKLTRFRKVQGGFCEIGMKFASRIK